MYNPWKSLASLSVITFCGRSISPSKYQIMYRSKAFLSCTKLVKAFIWNSMEYCSPLWAGAHTSHLLLLGWSKTRSFCTIGISWYEMDSQRISLFNDSKSVGSLFYTSLHLGLLLLLSPNFALSPSQSLMWLPTCIHSSPYSPNMRLSK